MKWPKCCALGLFLALALGASCSLADTLYVGDSTIGSNVYQFDTVIGSGSQTLVAGSVGLNPRCITVDRSGNLFIGNGGDGVTDFGDIYEITTNGTVTQIATGLYYPEALAVDSQGDLFEAEVFTSSLTAVTSLNEFVNTGGTLSSTPIAFGDGLDGPLYLAFDGSGDLFEADQNTSNIHEFTNTANGLGSTALPTPFDNNNFSLYAPLAFDANGDLFVGGSWGVYGPAGFGINVYSNTAGVLASTPSAFYATPDQVYGIAIDSGGNVFYVGATATVEEFINNAGTLSTTPTTFESTVLTFGSRLAIFRTAPPPPPPPPPSLLYVAANQSIYSFNPALGNASQSTITSGLPFEPVAMAVDPSGNVFVSDGLSTIYEIPTNGVPILLSSDLNGPVALACDTNGNLFEADYNSSSIYEFPNVSGSVSTTPELFASDGSFAALAFDNQGDLIASWGGAVNFVEYPQTGGILSSTESYLPATQNGVAGSLAFDQNGDLVAGFPTGEWYTPAGDGIFENVINNSAAWYNGGVLAATANAVATENVAGLVCDTNGNLFVVDGDSGNVVEYPNNAGTFSSPPNLFVGGLGAPCVAMNARVQTPSVPAIHNLYVSGFDSSIYAYNTTNGTASQITFAAGSDGGNLKGLTFDANGNLFVCGLGSIAEFLNNSGTVSSNRIILDLDSYPASAGVGVAFDQSGNMWACSDDYDNIYKFVYSGTVGVWHDPNAPAPWLQGGATSLAFAGPTEQCAQIRGNLFANVNGAIREYANMSGPYGTQTFSDFGAINNYQASCLAFDGSGNLFVGYYTQGDATNVNGFIYEFIASPGALSTTPTLFASGLGVVTSLAFDASGNLFETEGDIGEEIGLINEFLNTSGGLSSTPVLFASGLNSLACMAIYIPTPPPTAGVATKLAFITEPPATTQAGATMATFTVQIEDAFGNSVAQSGFMVQVSGPGGLTGNTAVTDATGLATFNNTSITLAGTSLAFSASTPGLLDAESTSFAITPGEGSTLAFTTEPAASTQAGVTMANVVVQIEDPYGNPVSQSGTAIMLGGVALAGGTNPQNTDAGGKATFNDLVVDTAGTDLVFMATSSGPITGSSTPFTITAAGPYQLAFSTEPAASTQAGTTMAAMVVQVEDLYGNAVSQNGIPVTLSGPGGLSGAAASTGANGQAVFAGTSITIAGEDLTLTAKSSGLANATSTQFNILAAAASKLAFLKEPAASSTAGMTMANIVLQIEDANGNFVSQSGAPITLGGVTLASGTDPVNTGAGGSVSFNDLVIDTAGTGLVFTANTTAPGLSMATSTPFAITPAPASQVAFTVEPAVTTQAGANMTPVTVQIEDPYFNHVAQGGTAITLGGVTLASGTNLKDTTGSGAAVFNGLIIDKAGTGLAFTAASLNLTTGTSTPFSIIPLATTKLAFTTEPAASTEVGQTMSRMVVQLEDLYSNAVSLSGTSVTLSGPSGLTGTAASTDVNGQAIFSSTSIATTGLGLTLTASALGLTTASTPFDINPAPQTYTLLITNGYNFIANQVNIGSNLLTEVLTNAPDLSVVFTWTGSSFMPDQLNAGAWDTNEQINPGEGFVLYNPGSNYFLTFTGMANTPTLPVSIACENYALLSRQTNGIGTYENITGMAPQDGVQMLVYSGGPISNINSSSYTIYTACGGGWSPGEPLIPVGGAVFIEIPCASDCVSVSETNIFLTGSGVMPVSFTPLVAAPCGGDNPVTIICRPPSGSYFPPGTTPVHCVALDISGNAASCDFTVTISPPPIAPVTETYTNNIKTGYNLICYQFINGGNTLLEIAPSVPDGTIVTKYNAATSNWLQSTFDATLGAWVPPNITLMPGEGAILQSPTNFFLPLVGQPNVPVLPLVITNDIALVGRQTNGVGTFLNIMGVSPAAGVTVYQLIGSSSNYMQFTYNGSTWSPFEPSNTVGQAWWISPSGNTAPPPIPVAPVITTQPVGLAVSQSGSALFSVVATGDAPLVYQWRLNGNAIPGATNSSLLINSVQPKNCGTYDVLVQNWVGTALSVAVPLTLTTANPLLFSDFFAAAGSIFTASGSGSGTNNGATLEPGEPSPGFIPGGASVWLKWQPPFNGVATFSTEGSGFDTLLAIYTGTSVTNLTPVASDDDSGGFLCSSVGFNAVQTSDYYIQVDGFYGSTGNIMLNWNLTPTSEQLPVIVMQPLSQTVGSNYAVNFIVTVQNGSGVSYQWLKNAVPILGATGPTLSLLNVTFPDVGIYQVLVSNAPGTLSALSLPADLQISMSGSTVNSGARADNKFQAEADTTVRPNDPYDPEIVSGYSGVEIFSSYGAGSESNPTNNCGVICYNTKWHAYTNTYTGLMSVANSGTEFPGVLAVYMSANVYEIPLACSSGHPMGQEAVSFAVTNGTTNYIAMSATNANVVGSVQLHYAQLTAPVYTMLPTNQAWSSNQNNSGLMLSVATTGNPTVQYQWMLNGTNIPNATNSYYDAIPFGLTNVGNYSVLATNIAGASLFQFTPAFPNNPPQFIGTTALSATNFYTELIGLVYSNYLFSTSTDLVNWVTNNVLASSPTGIITLTDTIDTNQAKLFYRAVLQPPIP